MLRHFTDTCDSGKDDCGTFCPALPLVAALADLPICTHHTRTSESVRKINLPPILCMDRAMETRDARVCEKESVSGRQEVQRSSKQVD